MPPKDKAATALISITPDAQQVPAAKPSVVAPKTPTAVSAGKIPSVKRPPSPKVQTGAIIATLRKSSFQGSIHEEIFQKLYDAALITDQNGKIVDANVRS